MIQIKRLKKSLMSAWRGIIYVYRSEQNFRIHVGVGLGVIFFAVWVKVTPIEAALLSFSIFGVLILEIVNTIFERTGDMLKPRIHDYVKYIKDLSSAAVLLAVLVSMIVGVTVLGPYFINLLNYPLK